MFSVLVFSAPFIFLQDPSTSETLDELSGNCNPILFWEGLFNGNHGGNLITLKKYSLLYVEVFCFVFNKLMYEYHYYYMFLMELLQFV